MTKDELIALAKQTATASGLDPALVCGICERESSWNPWAIRYEPAFFIRYIDPLGLTDATEARARAFSWSLGQVMGQTAREVGYTGSLAALCDPQTALEQLCNVLKSKLKRADGDVEQALQYYNGGGNPNYATEVLALAKSYANVTVT